MLSVFGTDPCVSWVASYRRSLDIVALWTEELCFARHVACTSILLIFAYVRVLNTSSTVA